MPKLAPSRYHVMNNRTLLRRPTGSSWHSTLPCHEQQSTAEKTKRCPRLLGAFLVYSRCTPGALLVHSWCISGSLLVHFWCTPGALLVHSRCTLSALLVHSRCIQRFPERELLRFRKEALILRTERLDRLFANLQTRKGIAPLPKGSLDPPHRNVWIAFSSICKPERELPRFRKEASILRTETFGSHSVKARANDPPHENVLDRPRNYHLYHRKGA